MAVATAVSFFMWENSMHTCELLLNLPANVADKIVKSSRTPCFHLSSGLTIEPSNDHVMNLTGDLYLTSTAADDRMRLRIHPFPLSFLSLLLLMLEIDVGVD